MNLNHMHDAIMQGVVGQTLCHNIFVCVCTANQNFYAMAIEKPALLNLTILLVSPTFLVRATNCSEIISQYSERVKQRKGLQSITGQIPRKRLTCQPKLAHDWSLCPFISGTQVWFCGELFFFSLLFSPLFPPSLGL